MSFKIWISDDLITIKVWILTTATRPCHITSLSKLLWKRVATGLTNKNIEKAWTKRKASMSMWKELGYIYHAFLLLKSFHITNLSQKFEIYNSYEAKIFPIHTTCTTFFNQDIGQNMMMMLPDVDTHMTLHHL